MQCKRAVFTCSVFSACAAAACRVRAHADADADASFTPGLHSPHFYGPSAQVVLSFDCTVLTLTLVRVPSYPVLTVTRVRVSAIRDQRTFKFPTSRFTALARDTRDTDTVDR